MASMSMDDFLKTFYRQLHTESMPESVLEQLVDDKKKGLLTGHQEEWFNDFFEADSSAPFGYKAKKTPKPAELDAAELENLYRAFALALAGMKSDSVKYDTVNDKEALDFVKKWFDDRHLFSTPEATDECKASITKIVDLLDEDGKNHDVQDTIKNIKTVIINGTKDASGKQLFSSYDDLKKLLTKCKDGKYNSDKSVQDKIQQVSNTLNDYLNEWTFAGEESKETSKQKNQKFLAPIADDLAIVARGDGFTKISLPANYDDFRDLYAEELLEELYHNKPVREKFAKHDTKGIVDKINKAEGKISWHDPKSDDYVNPKINDKLTPLQQLEKWAKDTYSDTFKKYEELRGGSVFFSMHAKEIFKAIDKANIKPVDGLNGLLDKENEVKKNIKNKTVEQHFNWFVETMKPIAEKMPKAVAGAWKRADQMKAVIEQIIMEATKPGAPADAMDKAKTTMEIMTAMKYGMMTSKVMDAMKQTDFKVFSDGDLSWNKNEGIKFVTQAFDKSIKAAFVTVGYGVTIIGNKIRQRNGKFTNQDNQKGVLAARFAQEKQDLADKKALDTHSYRTQLSEKNRIIDDNRKTIENLNKYDNINDRTLEMKGHAVEAIKGKMDGYQRTMEEKKAGYDAYVAAEDTIAQRADKKRHVDDLAKKRDDLAKKVSDLESKLADPATYAGMPDAAANAKAVQIQQELNAAKQEHEAAQKEFIDANKEYGAFYSSEYLKAQRVRTANLSTYKEYVAAQTSFNNAQTAHNELQDKIEQFKEAKESLNEAIEQTNEINKNMRTWDQTNINKVKELQDFWDFLQDGKTKTWRFSTKVAQKNFDNNKMAEFAAYQRKYGLAA